LNQQKRTICRMTDDDENELHRLCDMLKEVHDGLDEGSPLREAVTKAGLGLSLAFMNGQRWKMEELAAGLGRPLDEGSRQRQELRRLGIDPDGE
jgi:hypothetical protein